MKKNKTLIAGPWLGEFGHELCKWVPYIRYLAWQDKYDKVAIVCRSGHEYLYSDFATEFYNDNTEGATSEHYIDNEVPFIKDWILNKFTEDNCVVIEPSRDIRDNTEKIFFLMYGIEPSLIRYDILIHARSTTKLGSGIRNWPESKWLELVSRYSNLKFASIGSKKDALHIHGTKDLRGIRLEKLAAQMKASKVLLSPSSGPAHFASLCGLPHIIWTDDKKHGVIGGYSNKHRYKTTWNPFGTFVDVIEHDKWNPSVSVVCGRLSNFLGSFNQPNKLLKDKKAPTISMVTYDRPDVFRNTLESLAESNVSLKNLTIFDDNSTNPYKNGYIREQKRSFNIITHSENMGVFVNTKIAIDHAWNMTKDRHIVYLQDDLEFSKDWYNDALKIIDEVNKSGIDWGFIALLHFNGQTDETYYECKESHPGGAAWIVNCEMWAQYRKENVIYDYECRGNRLSDYKLYHWCKNNGKREWAVLRVGKSLVKHTGNRSTMHDKDLSEYTGLGFNGTHR